MSMGADDLPDTLLVSRSVRCLRLLCQLLRCSRSAETHDCAAPCCKHGLILRLRPRCVQASPDWPSDLGFNADDAVARLPHWEQCCEQSCLLGDADAENQQLQLQIEQLLSESSDLQLRSKAAVCRACSSVAMQQSGLDR